MSLSPPLLSVFTSISSSLSVAMKCRNFYLLTFFSSDLLTLLLRGSYSCVTFVVFNQNDSGLHQKIHSILLLLKTKMRKILSPRPCCYDLMKTTSFETALSGALGRRGADIYAALGSALGRKGLRIWV